MYPHIEILGIEVASPMLMLAVAVIAGGAIGVHRGRVACDGVGLGRVLGAVALIAVIVFVGGRAHFVFNRWHSGFFQANLLEIPKFWKGLHAPGALVGLLVGTPLALRLLGLRLGRFADAFAPAVFVGIGFARLGCFLNGCCIGVRCIGPLCLAYPPGSRGQRVHMREGSVGVGEWSEAVHPFALYIVAICVVAAVVAFYVERRRRYDGQAALWSGAVYLVGAAAVETIRSSILPASFGWGGMTQLELNAFVLAMLAVGALLVAERRAGHRDSRLTSDVRIQTTNLEEPS